MEAWADVRTVFLATMWVAQYAALWTAASGGLTDLLRDPRQVLQLPRALWDSPGGGGQILAYQPQHPRSAASLPGPVLSSETTSAWRTLPKPWAVLFSAGSVKRTLSGRQAERILFRVLSLSTVAALHRSLQLSGRPFPYLQNRNNDCEIMKIKNKVSAGQVLCPSNLDRPALW